MALARQDYFSPDDKRYLLNICYSIDWDSIIRRYPPYAALLERRPLAQLNPDYFSEQTYRDLIVWFNLAWTDPNLLESDPLFQRLVQKGGILTRRCQQPRIAPLADNGRRPPHLPASAGPGQIEIITVPYYHPILPLLVDSEIARRRPPDCRCRSHPFVGPRCQRKSPRRGAPPGSGTSPRACGPAKARSHPRYCLAAEHGIRWLATDEAVLGRSLGVYFERERRFHPSSRPALSPLSRAHRQRRCCCRLPRPRPLRPHRLHLPESGGEQAAEDMIVRLKHVQHAYAIRTDLAWSASSWTAKTAGNTTSTTGMSSCKRSTPLAARPRPGGGDRLRASGRIPGHRQLPELASGSWIRGDFTTWIGDPEHTEAWRVWVICVRASRMAGDRPAASQIPKPDATVPAEGSDWFWWYSPRNCSDQDALFDHAFQDYLAAAYRVMGDAPARPDDAHPGTQRAGTAPRGPIHAATNG